MTREDRLKAVEICADLATRCTGCPLYPFDECEVIVALTKEVEALKSKPEEKLIAMAHAILDAIEAALRSNYAARKERIEKGHTSDDFLSVIEGKIAALRGMQGFVEELLDDMLEHLPKKV